MIRLFHFFAPVLSASLLLLSLTPPALAATVKPADFNRDIRPILSDNCYACHGPDEKARKAKLRLDQKDAAFQKHEDGFVIVPGKPAESKLIERITATDPDDLMPPPKSGKKLSAAQIDVLRRWIVEGAKWEQHWSFIPPLRPPLPAVRDEQWPRNPIDNFILARLEHENLHPSREASKERLIRRVTYDLTGLPPSLQDIDAFLRDDSDMAYEKVVDRLLNSPAYGEHMAVHWLDLARYADTHGYHLDAGRDMWKWREWVIDAFNSNEPFDQFVVEQLAGDLLPNPTTRQILATGFNRNNMINFEGGAIPEEYLTQYVFDRVATTSTVFLGLTMGCAQCHDHKFDPITHREYYQFYAFFNAVPENGLDGTKGNAAPFISLPSPEQKAELHDLEARLGSARQDLEKLAPELDTAQAAWEQTERAALFDSWKTLVPDRSSSQGGATLTVQSDHSLLAGGTNPDKDVYEIETTTHATQITALRLEALTDPALPHQGPGRHDNASFVLSEVELEAVSTADPTRTERIAFASALADYAQKNFPVANLIDGKPDTGWAVDAPERHRKATAWLIPSHPFGFPDGTKLRWRLHFESSYSQHALGRARLALTTDAAAAKREALPPSDALDALALAPAQRTPEQKSRLQQFFRESASEPYRKANAEVARLQKSIADLKKSFPTSMVMGQMEHPRDTFVLTRGQYNQPTEKVEPGVPASLPPLPRDAPPNRLGLARWLVAPNHPLTARVTVNRFWQMVMGTGIVKTANDFGSQGEWPTHPQLLDWMAREFIESGWDVKHMMKLLVTSATYRQSSRATPALLAKDPYNRLYARAPRFRLSAEEIRDTALAVSGLLVKSMGGPSVSPYQPPGLWSELSSRKDSGNWSAQRFVQSHGPDLYRRSLYTFWKRTSPPPSLTAFDAPNRETCTVARERTSTPLQALVLIDDPTYTEASRVLAERTMTQGGTKAEERIAFAFRLATARMPTARETGILLDLFQKQHRRFSADPQKALSLLQVGEMPRDGHLDPAELAAWTSVASTILNLDETINKG